MPVCAGAALNAGEATVGRMPRRSAHPQLVVDPFTSAATETSRTCPQSHRQAARRPRRSTPRRTRRPKRPSSVSDCVGDWRWIDGTTTTIATPAPSGAYDRASGAGLAICWRFGLGDAAFSCSESASPTSPRPARPGVGVSGACHAALSVTDSPFEAPSRSINH